MIAAKRCLGPFRLLHTLKIQMRSSCAPFDDETSRTAPNAVKFESKSASADKTTILCAKSVAVCDFGPACDLCGTLARVLSRPQQTKSDGCERLLLSKEMRKNTAP
jgi:hypothetical protein